MVFTGCGGTVVCSQIPQPLISVQSAVSAPGLPTISHTLAAGNCSNSAGSAVNKPGSESVQSFQYSRLSAENDSSSCTQSATDKVPVEKRTHSPPKTLQGSDDESSSCNEFSFKKPCSEPIMVANCIPVKNDVSKEKMSQSPLALSLNSSQSSASAFPSGHLSEVSSDEERSFHAPLARSPQLSISAALVYDRISAQPRYENQIASSSADVESTVDLGSSATQGNGSASEVNAMTLSQQDGNNKPASVTDIDPARTKQERLASGANVTAISQQDGNNKAATDSNLAETKQKELASGGNVTVISQQEGNIKPATENPVEITKDWSVSDADVTAISQQDGNNKAAENPVETTEDRSVFDADVTAIFKLEGNSKPATDDSAEIKQERSAHVNHPIIFQQDCDNMPATENSTERSSQQVSDSTPCIDQQESPTAVDDNCESSTLPTDHISSGTGESSAAENKSNSDGNSSPHVGPIIFNPPHDKAINIYFKALLPKTAWEWDNSSAFIHFMQLNCDLVGTGSCTHVDQGLVSELVEFDVKMGLVLVEFDVKIHRDVLCSYSYILYKYVVHSHRMEGQYPYEYLYGAQIEGVADTKYIYRALKIDRNKCLPGGKKCK